VSELGLSSAGAALLGKLPPAHFCSTVVRLLALQVRALGVSFIFKSSQLYIKTNFSILLIRSHTHWSKHLVFNFQTLGRTSRKLCLCICYSQCALELALVVKVLKFQF
jgi:hypothetical protein